MPTIGAFTPGVARLLQPGAVEFDRGNAPKSVTDVWGVILARGTRPGAISSISGLPLAGSAHPTYPYLARAGVTIRNAVEMAGSLVWMIDVAYEPESTSSSVVNPGGGGHGTPSVVRIVGREWPVYEVQTDLVADALTGDALLNSAGDPFDRVPQVTRRYMGARVKRAEQNWPELASTLDGTLNDAEIAVLGVTFPKRTARLEVTIEDALAVGSETRYIVTYDIVPCHNVYGVDANGDPLDAGYDIPLVEKGYRYIDGDGALVRATTVADNGSTTTAADPVLLDANGARLAANADPVVSIWAAYDEADWTDLGLPDTPTAQDPTVTTPST